MRRAAFVIATLAIPVAIVIGLAFGLAACGDDGSSGPTPTQTVTVTATPTVAPTDDPSAIMTVSLYFLRGETLGVAHRAVPASGAPATAAMNALLAGPNKRERAAGLTSAVPAGVDLHGVVIDSDTKVATVDLGSRFGSGGGSASMQARVAQVVYTLTQFPTVRAVRFLIDGKPDVPLGGEGLLLEKPQTRAEWQELLPAIFVESPAVGDSVPSPVAVKGMAMVFEATFVLEVLGKDGDVLTRKVVMADAGAPERGSFSARLTFSGAGRNVILRAYQESMEDGSPLDEVMVPLRVTAD